MKKFISLILMFFLSGASYADDSSFKKQTLDDYENRCISVLTKKGYEIKVVKKECLCERNIIEREFSTFELMMAAGKRMVGKDLIDKEKVSEIKNHIGKCKEKHLPKLG